MQLAGRVLHSSYHLSKGNGAGMNMRFLAGWHVAARRNKTSQSRVAETLRHGIEALERRLFLDGSENLYHIVASPSNSYAYTVGQHFTFAGQVVDASGNGVPGIQVLADDSVAGMSRIVGTTDANGSFSLSDTAGNDGLFAI